MNCPECHYRREERAGIHEFLGGLSRAEAERRADAEERCAEHGGVVSEAVSESERVKTLEGGKMDMD